MSFENLKARAVRHEREGLCRSCPRPAAEGRKLCDEHLAYHRRLKRDVRAERRKAGLCLCGRKPKPGRAQCPSCVLRCVAATKKARDRRKAKARNTRAYLRQLHSHGLCTACKAAMPPGDTSWRCAACRAAKNASECEDRAERRIVGDCRCGQPPRPGFDTCERCARKARLENRRRVARRRAAGLCQSCKEPAVAASGGRFCGRHLKAHLDSKARFARRRDRKQEVADATQRRAA